MDNDLLAHMEDLTIKASDIDPATAAGAPPEVAPPVQTPLEGVPPTASHGVNVGQKSTGQKNNDEMKKVSGDSLHVSAEAGGPSSDVALGHAVSEDISSAAAGGGNVGKKNSRKRRNRKERKIVYLPWPLTLQTRASSAAQFLSQNCVMGSFPVANMGQASMGQREDDETSVVAQPSKTLNSVLLPEASGDQFSLEEASMATSREIEVQYTSRYKGRNKKTTKIVHSPWPMTVQAWASFTGPVPEQAIITGSSPMAKDAVSVGPKSGSQRGENSMSILTSCQNTEADSPGSPGAPGLASAPEQSSLEDLSPDSNNGEKVGKNRRCKRNQREHKGVLSHLWPLTVQAWASFTVADPAQTLLQREPPGRESWPLLKKSEKERKSVIPWSEEAQDGAHCSVRAPLQTVFEGTPLLEDIHSKLNKLTRGTRRRDERQLHSSVELTLEPCQGWGNAERYQGDQNLWERTVMNFARQVDRCYCGELCSQETVEALTLTKAHTHINTSVVGMQGTEKEGAESQTIWMGKWGGF